MDDKKRKIFVTIGGAGLVLSLVFNAALFWQNKEMASEIEKQNLEQKTEATTNSVSKYDELFDDSSKTESSSTFEDSSTSESQIEQEENTNSDNQISSIDEPIDQQNALAKEFSQIVVGKTTDIEKMTKTLEPIATKNVMDLLIPTEENLPTVENEDFEINFLSVDCYVDVAASDGESKKYTVLLDYQLKDNNLNEESVIDVKGGVTLTESFVDDTWKVSSFEYFSR